MLLGANGTIEERCVSAVREERMRMAKRKPSRPRTKPLSLSGANPLDFEDDTTFGDWLHKRLMREYGHQAETWAVQRVRQAQERLQQHRFPEQRRQAEILWIKEETAFAVPGRYI